MTDGHNGMMFVISMYERLVAAPNMTHDRIIEVQAMAMTHEGLEKWPEEYRRQLMDVFNDAIGVPEGVVNLALARKLRMH